VIEVVAPAPPLVEEFPLAPPLVEEVAPAPPLVEEVAPATVSKPPNTMLEPAPAQSQPRRTRFRDRR
jgi:hypothetical protein